MRAMRWFSLDDVFPNTYQPRTSEDPEHVRKLADSIMRDGLLQIPVGRSLNLSDQVELAFGHSRLAAYKLLAETSNSYKKIPVEIRELDDTQMFELAIAENVARKDLTPIEEARAMQRYREEFGKNSVEIGALFGISDSAVRNKLRLLELPESAQESLKAGQIGEGSARRLLTLNRVRPEKVADVIQTAVEKELTPQEIEKEVSRTLDRDGSVKLMWPSWKKNEDTPLGGDGLWPLDWKPEKSGKSCTACEHYIRMDDNHYCASLDGWKQRKNEWMNAELIRLRDELGIPVYDRKADGKTFVEYIAWKNRDQFLAWFRERDAGLRLRIAYSPYQMNRLTDSHCVDMISVDAAEVAKIEREKTRGKSEADSFEAQRQRRQRSERFIEAVAAPCFAVQMGAPMDGPLPSLTKIALGEVLYHLTEKHEALPEDPRALRDLYRKLVAFKLILEELTAYRTRELGPVAVAAELKGYLEAWGIAVPGDWEEKAREFEESES